MADLPEGFDAASLFANDEPELAQPATEPEATPEKPEKPEKEPAAEPEADFDDDDMLTLDELEERLGKMTEAASERAVRKVVAEARAEADPEADPRDKKIADLEAKLAETTAKAAKQEQERLAETVTHEVKSCVGKYKMTAAEIEDTIKFFEHNPDLEGVWPFERAALRVNPDLRGRLTPANGDAPHAGRPEQEPASVVARGAGSNGNAQPPKFTPRRGDYSDVTAAIKGGNGVRSMFTNRPEQ